MQYPELNMINVTHMFLYDALKGKKHISKIVYNMLIGSNPLRNVDKYREKWINLGINMTEEMYQAKFGAIKQVTSIVKYRDFQYRLLLHKIVTNKDLASWNVIESKLCSFGCQQDEDIIHLLYSCSYVQQIWRDVENTLNSKGYTEIEMDLSARTV